IAGLMTTLFPELMRHVTDTSLLPPVLFGLGAINLAEQPDGVMAIFGLKRQAKRQARRERALARASAPAGDEAAQSAASSASTDDGREPVRAAAALASSPGPTPNGAGNGGGGDVDTSAALVLEGIRAGYAGAQVLHDVSITV